MNEDDGGGMFRAGIDGKEFQGLQRSHTLGQVCTARNTSGRLVPE